MGLWLRLLLSVVLGIVLNTQASTIWEEGHPTPGGGIGNPYQLDEPALAEHIEEGRVHALNWPVDVTGPLLPYRPIRCLLDLDCFGWPFSAVSMHEAKSAWVPEWGSYAAAEADPYSGPYADPFATEFLSAAGGEHDLEAFNAQLRELFAADDDGAFFEEPNGKGGGAVPYFFPQPRAYSFDWWMRWLGLYHYPDNQGGGVFRIPYPNGAKPDYRMGVSLIDRNGVQGLSFSCSACHLEELFGRAVLGLTTRFPRANKFIHRSSRLIHKVNGTVFQRMTGATNEEVAMLQALKPVMRLVDTREPQVLGLDTALAQVGLSLRRRGLDGTVETGKSTFAGPGWFNTEEAYFPVSDSKPSVWWNVKYKNRWLSDGSLVAGNPVVTNILWNEVGRGSNLDLLEQWLDDNTATVREITTMVYASEAPHITDFFDAGRIDIAAAQRGEKIFNEHCKGCHGRYLKNWSLSTADQMTPAQRLKTQRVEYPAQTKVKDVGTDAARREALGYLLPLNALPISKNHGVKLKVSKGYVPPPLVGIWARWPYLHNNSVPTLCALLETAENRPKIYYARPAINQETDFDFDCNGYPEPAPGARFFKYWSAYRYDTDKEGMTNVGHDVGIIFEDEQEILSAQDKHDLIRFLQTL